MGTHPAVWSLPVAVSTAKENRVGLKKTEYVDESNRRSALRYNFLAPKGVKGMNLKEELCTDITPSTVCMYRLH